VEPPPAPEFLSDYARAEWDRIAKELYRLRLLTVVDIAPLAAYCESYSAWRMAVEKLKEMAARDPVMRGLMVKTRHDSVMQNPLFLTMRQAANDMVRYASEFGFTPAARSRISTIEAQPAPGKFDGLIA
jgi:P27 family predicted phage terminase small subunit